MTMAVSDSFQATYAQGGFGYVCLPWVSKFQWHAFSLFEHPTVRVLRCIDDAFDESVSNVVVIRHARIQIFDKSL